MSAATCKACGYTPCHSIYETECDIPARQFCKSCGAGIGKYRRDGEGTCPACDPAIALTARVAGLEAALRDLAMAVQEMARIPSTPINYVPILSQDEADRILVNARAALAKGAA